jgi:hypothetical protein
MANKILSDHTQKGKVFTPPLLKLGNFIEISWIDLQVPELIWILFLIERYGPTNGASLALDIAKISDRYISPKIDANPISAMMLSSYAVLTPAEQTEIRSCLDDFKILLPVQLALENFFILFPDCLLTFLSQSIPNPMEGMLIPYKETLSKILDRVSYESTIVLASVCNFMLTMDRLKVAQNSNLPDLAEILQYPNTESSVRLATFLRSAIKTCFGHVYNPQNDWIRYFWNRNLAFEPPTI